jgi:hypothetical protein
MTEPRTEVVDEMLGVLEAPYDEVASTMIGARWTIVGGNTTAGGAGAGTLYLRVEGRGAKRTEGRWEGRTVFCDEEGRSCWLDAGSDVGWCWPVVAAVVVAVVVVMSGRHRLRSFPLSLCMAW